MPTRKLHEEEWDGPRYASCVMCSWKVRTDPDTTRTMVTRLAREHAQTHNHRVTVATVRTLQLIPMRYAGDGRWHQEGKQERRARLERRANNA